LLELQKVVLVGGTSSAAEKTDNSDKADANIAHNLDTQSVHSESDNEAVNLNDEFEKIVPSKVIESIDEIINEAVEKVTEEIENTSTAVIVDDATNINIVGEGAADEKIIDSDTVEKSEVEEKIETSNIETVAIVSPHDEEKIDEILENKVEQIENLKANEILDEATAVCENISSTQIDIGANETLIDSELLTKEIIEKYIADSQKPPVPIQTYLWEDLKRSKEQVSGDHVCKS
jgi:tRNA uridine 5-carbamoylmethylation protein Kti12